MDYDYDFECSVCGKPMAFRYCGMCVECEQIDDGVPPEAVADYSTNGLCPQCGSELEVQITGGACGESFQYCKGKNCGWTSVNTYDC